MLVLSFGVIAGTYLCVHVTPDTATSAAASVCELATLFFASWQPVNYLPLTYIKI
jgi:hypothetical protein